MRGLTLALAVAACAAPQPREAASSDVSPLLAGRIAGPAQTCIEADDVTILRVLDRHVLGLERGGVLWVSRLAQDCPRLSSSDALAVEMHGREYCRGDRFRTITPGMTVAGPVCTLGEFVPYRRPR